MCNINFSLERMKTRIDILKIFLLKIFIKILFCLISHDENILYEI